MVEFKIGDRVKKLGGKCNSAEPGCIYTVQNDNDGLAVGSKANDLCHCKNEWELISNNQPTTIMSKLNSMMKRLLDKDTQVLIKAGLINGDLLLTPEGQNALNALNFDSHKAELVKVAQEILDEAKEESK